MSTTPRTDAAYFVNHEACETTLRNLYRISLTLETDLTALAARLAEVERERDRWKQMWRVRDDDSQRAMYKREQAITERDTLAADNARLKELLSDCDNTFANGPHRDNPIRQNIQKALSTKGGDEPCQILDTHTQDSVRLESEASHTQTSESLSSAAPENVPPVPASGNEGTPETDAAARSITYWCDFWKDGLVNLVPLADAQKFERQRNAALRDRYELKRRVEELEKRRNVRDPFGWMQSWLNAYEEAHGSKGTLNHIMEWILTQPMTHS